MSAIYNFDEQFTDNTLKARVFKLERFVGGDLQKLTGATVHFEVFRSSPNRLYLSRSTNTTGVSIADPETCLVNIHKIDSPALTAFDYNYRIRVEYSNGDIFTILSGKMPIIDKPKSYVKHDC